MKRKTSTHWFFNTLAGCASSILITNPALSLSLSEQTHASSPSSAAFQSAIERLHNDLLLSDCHTSNSEIQQCLDVVASRDSSVTKRCDAAAQIGSLKGMAQSAVVPLVRIFSAEADYSVKSAIALALVQISPTVAVQQLLPGIESKEEDYKQLCVAAIFSGGKEVVPPLLKALKCPDPNIRRQSAKALAELGANAISAVTVLKQISTNADENSLFAEQAARSAVEIKRDYDEKTGPDVAFNADSWKDESGRHYRFRMVRDLIESHVLIGLHTAQLQAMLGRGVCFFKGAQWRYALGLRGKENLVAYRHNKKEKSSTQQIAGSDSRSSSTASAPRTSAHLSTRVTIEEDQEQFLVVHVVDDVVTNCQLLAYDPNLWNVTNLDKTVPAAGEDATPRLRAAVSYALFSKPQRQLPILAKFSERIRK
ncbi:MAG: HEAT repeat domain-containing protein [Candidatus Obscuribacterales bacterium]|nr:HEAT repeat domain-containing protein [Candidatus Obscuribacterales bacterium]